MALDAIAVRALAKEIGNAVIGGRIDKIYQPERDEIVLGIRTFKDNYKLLLCANSTYPRAAFYIRQILGQRDFVLLPQSVNSGLNLLKTAFRL